ncbi:Vacuolar protein sorting-associated protein 52, partial [Perkinsus olseni]
MSSSPPPSSAPPAIPDFTALATKFEKLAEAGDSADHDSLLRALKAGEPLDDLKASLDEEARLLRHAVLAEFSAKSKNLVELNKRAQEADEALSRIEKDLDGFQSHLRGVSDEIRSLQHSSLVMNDKLKNRLAVQQELQDYVHKVVVSPALVKGICEVPADSDGYASALEELSSKITAF